MPADYMNSLNYLRLPEKEYETFIGAATDNASIQLKAAREAWAFPDPLHYAAWPVNFLAACFFGLRYLKEGDDGMYRWNRKRVKDDLQALGHTIYDSQENKLLQPTTHSKGMDF